MTEDCSMDTSEPFDIERFRLSNESDQQWFYRKQFIEAFRCDYNEERLLCLAQCYANTKCLGCKYSEPLKSLLEQLSDKLSNSAVKRPTSYEPVDVNNKRIPTMSNRTTVSNEPSNFDFSSTSNFVSFSSPTPAVSQTQSQSTKPSPIDPKALLHESAEAKLARLQTFAEQLKQSTDTAQTRMSSDDNDQAIEHIYRVGNQVRLFIDYRPDELTNQLNAHGTHATSFLTQTFRGKLYIDEVYVCSGQGTNKKLCKRNCFQQALARFFNESLDIKSIFNKNGREQYELITKASNNSSTDVTMQENQDRESFGIPVGHPMANTTMNFVHARDTSTMAQRIAREQNKLERQYWQQWGRGSPLTTRFRRNQRSLSPPPPVPHQSIAEDTNAVIEAGPTTQTYVNGVVADIERAAHEQENKSQSGLIYPFPAKSVESEMNSTSKKQAPQPICSEAAKNAIDPALLTQLRAKLTKMQSFLFSLLNTLADASHSIDLISTQINKYHLQADFECADKPTVNGFHGHLIVEQIELADGYGINKKLAKKQAYGNALKSISSAKSFSLELRDQLHWSLVCHPDDTGLLPIPPPRRPAALRNDDERPSRWGPPTNLSAVTNSSTSAVRHFHERRVEEGSQREREYHASTGVCIPPPALIEPPLTRVEIGKDLSKCVSSTDEAIVNNIRRLIPNTFVVFELLDFDENIPGHYVSMLFTSMSKNKLELKYEFVHVPTGFMITYTVNERFFMSWIASTKIAAKQNGAKKAIEMLKTLYPTIKTKNVADAMSANDYERMNVKRKLITRTHMYDQQSLISALTSANNSTNAPPKEDMGSKLLKKMGWVGGGIGKDLQGIAEPIQIEDLQGRKGLGSNSLFPNQIFIKNLRRILEDFIATNDDDGELQFANEFNSEERKSIHKEAMKLHLTSNSYGRDNERRIRITQKRNVDQLVDHLLTHGGETVRYELKVQTQPTSTVRKSSQRTYTQMAPPPSQWTAPDACDDGTL